MHTEFFRGFVVASCIFIPVIGFVLGMTVFWEHWAKFWKMLHKDLSDQNETLFSRIKEYDDVVWPLLKLQKYKRCVAMEKMCRDNYVFRKSLSDKDQWYWRRWHKRWQLLAEKFKPEE